MFKKNWTKKKFHLEKVFNKGSSASNFMPVFFRIFGYIKGFF
jgi:hypothetical protein